MIAGGGIARGMQYGKSDTTASSPKDNPVHPNELSGDHLLRARHRPGHGDPQPSEPAARTGEGRTADEVVRINVGQASACGGLQPAFPRLNEPGFRVTGWLAYETISAVFDSSPICATRIATVSPAASAASSVTMMPVPVSSTDPAGT